MTALPDFGLFCRWHFAELVRVRTQPLLYCPRIVLPAAMIIFG